MANIKLELTPEEYGDLRIAMNTAITSVSTQLELAQDLNIDILKENANKRLEDYRRLKKKIDEAI